MRPSEDAVAADVERPEDTFDAAPRQPCRFKETQQVSPANQRCTRINEETKPSKISTMNNNKHWIIPGLPCFFFVLFFLPQAAHYCLIQGYNPVAAVIKDALYVRISVK